MPDALLKRFKDKFTEVAGRNAAVFGQDHKIQIQKLGEIADLLNADGTFNMTFSEPDPLQFSIKHVKRGVSVLFTIGFGNDAFSGSAALRVYQGLDKAPLVDRYGKEIKPAVLQFTGESEKLVDALAYAVGSACIEEQHRKSIRAARKIK